MNPPRWDDWDSIPDCGPGGFHLHGGGPMWPEGAGALTPDAFTRLLPRQLPGPEALGQEAKAFVDIEKGLLVLDDTTLGEP